MHVRGRQIELIKFESGRIVSLINVTGVLHKNLRAIQQFQIVRTGEYTFLIRIVAGPQFEKARPEIIEHLQKLLHPKVEVIFDTVTPIAPGPNGKARVFIDQTVPVQA
jgi:hypothetical protein